MPRTARPAKSVPDFIFKDYDWLVNRRSKIEDLLLTQYRFAKRNRAVVLRQWTPQSVNSIRQDLFALYVGAAFSLWRAVFLNDKDRTRLDTVRHAVDLLDIVISTNAIAFAAEKKLNKWMGGYYLNNAWFRLDEALRIREKHGMKEQEEKREKAYLNFANLKEAEREVKPFRDVWDILHDELDRVFKLL